MEIILFTQSGANRRRLHLGPWTSACALGAVGGLVFVVAAALFMDTPAARAAGAMTASATRWVGDFTERHVVSRWDHVVAVITGEEFEAAANVGFKPSDGAARQYGPQAALESEEERIGRVIRSTEQGIDALALRLGTLQAHIVRLDALGSRLVDMAKLDAEEFAFGEQPARGGPRPGEVPVP